MGAAVPVQPFAGFHRAMNSETCICCFPSTCGGLGVVFCGGCGGDICVCAACHGQGEQDCDCEMCAAGYDFFDDEPEPAASKEPTP
jgi:hypothetical protein